MNNRTMAGVFLLVALVFWGTPATAFSQLYLGPQYGIGSPAYGYGYGGNYGYGGTGYGLGYGLGYGAGLGYGGAQTPYSAELTGMGNLVRAEGDYNKRTSEALVNYEKAQNQYIENQQKAIAARQTAKRLGQAEAAKDREAAHESLVRAEQYIASHRPQPLSHSQLDLTTGQVHWPAALIAKEFDPLRSSLESLFATRAKSGANSVLNAQISRKVGEMKDSLRSQILNIPLAEYSEARRFLDSLAVSVN